MNLSFDHKPPDIILCVVGLCMRLVYTTVTLHLNLLAFMILNGFWYPHDQCIVVHVENIHGKCITQDQHGQFGYHYT